MLVALAGRAVRLALGAGVAVLALAAAVAAGFAAQAWWRLPELQPWHRVHLAEEYSSGRRGIDRFEAYLALEQRLFTELQQRVLSDPAAAGLPALSRYRPGSAPAQLAAGEHNRSTVQMADGGRGAVLLLHGLSDAPYSMHAIGRRYRERGFHVVSLRLPGHGTIPAALTRVRHEDWSAAVELAARHAAELAGPGRPLHVAGYSTGGALALDYALKAIERSDLPRPARVLLFSPALGLGAGAAASRIADALAFVPGLEKAAWMDVLPEYDPHKYNSFPVNAATQIYQLTQVVESRMAAAAQAGRLDRLPGITAFVSIVDATVQADDVYRLLFARLPAGPHELVLFDVNRAESLVGLITPRIEQAARTIEQAPPLRFPLTRIGNRRADSAEVVAWVRAADSTTSVAEPLGLAWPPGLLSLGHLALVLPPDDPLYGLAPALPPGRAFTLGGQASRSESGALLVSAATLARPRSNPFFAVVVDRIDRATADAAR